jgi:hypothetical protein
MKCVQDFGVTNLILNLMCRVDNPIIEGIFPDLLLYFVDEQVQLNSHIKLQYYDHIRLRIQSA